jgi:hypothetical protein
VPCALCPVPCALCPVPCALCPVPCVCVPCADPLVTTRGLDWYPLDLWNLATPGQSGTLVLPQDQSDLNCTATGLYSRVVAVPLEYTAKPTDHFSITITYSGVCVCACACVCLCAKGVCVGGRWRGGCL